MKILDEFANKCEENTEEDDEAAKKKRLEMKQRQEDVEQFMLAVDRMKQAEKGLYKPLSSKFKKLVLVSRLVFALKDAEEGEGGKDAGGEVEEDKKVDQQEGERGVEGNKKDEQDSPSPVCAMDLAKTFEY